MISRGLPATCLGVACFSSVMLLAGTVKAQAHVTCVGDSITVGNGTSSPVAAYPSVLQGLLGSSFAVENDGHSGATMTKAGDVPYWSVAQFDSSTAWAAAGGDVVIQLGTNDSKASNWVNKASFLPDCQALVEHYKQAPGKPRVWLNLMPPASTTACCEIDGATIANEIIPLLKTCAAATGASTIDVYSALAGHVDSMVDGVHPDDAGAALVAKTVYDALAKKPSVGLTAASAAAAGAAQITLTATPTAAYGKVEKVVFFEGTAVKQEITASPWVLTLDSVQDGSHVYRAETVETAGRTSTSVPITVVVAEHGASVSTHVGDDGTGTSTDGAGGTTAGGDGTPAPSAGGASASHASGCACRSIGHGDLATSGALLFALASLVGARRARSRRP